MPQNNMHVQPLCGLVHNYYQRRLLTDIHSNTIGSLRNGMFYVYSCVLQHITDYVLCAVNYCVSLLCTMTCHEL